MRTTPNALKDARAFGFNMLSFANNHSMDFSHDGLMATKRAVDEADFPNTGAGANLDEASTQTFHF